MRAAVRQQLSLPPSVSHSSMSLLPFILWAWIACPSCLIVPSSVVEQTSITPVASIYLTSFRTNSSIAIAFGIRTFHTRFLNKYQRRARLPSCHNHQTTTFLQPINDEETELSHSPTTTSPKHPSPTSLNDRNASATTTAPSHTCRPSTTHPEETKTTMLSLLASLFTPPPPRCHNTGSLLLASRRAAIDAKYTARPLDFFPNHLVPRQMLEETRREAGVLDEMFGRYKREAKCGSATGRLRNCETCGDWCCNACRFHASYRVICSSPLIFSDEYHLPPGITDHAMLVPDKRMQTLQIRLRDHEHPYALALLHLYARRWHGYCHACLPRVSTSLIQQLDGRFDPCRCERSDTAKRYRGRWICLSCFEDECNEVLGQDFDSKECKGRGCGATVAQVGWDKFQPVCGWCLRIVDAKGIEGARQALRDGEGFESLRRDSRRS